MKNSSSFLSLSSALPATANSSSQSTQTSSSQFQFPIIASKLSEVYIWGGGKLLPKRVDFFKHENAPLKVAIGLSHYAVITVEKELFTWSVKLITIIILK